MFKQDFFNLHIWYKFIVSFDQMLFWNSSFFNEYSLNKFAKKFSKINYASEGLNIINTNSKESDPTSYIIMTNKTCMVPKMCKDMNSYLLRQL